MSQSHLTKSVQRALVTHLVSRAITCPRTGEVLDTRTCVVLVDREGDPAVVVSQKGWALIVEEGGDTRLKDLGLTADLATVKA